MKSIFILKLALSWILAALFGIVVFLILAALDTAFRAVRGLELYTASGLESLGIFAIFGASTFVFASKVTNATCLTWSDNPLALSLQRKRIALLAAALFVAGLASGLSVKRYEHPYTELTAASLVVALVYFVADIFLIARLAPDGRKLAACRGQLVTYAARLTLLLIFMILYAGASLFPWIRAHFA